jgi:hypothetical protein
MRIDAGHRVSALRVRRLRVAQYGRRQYGEHAAGRPVRAHAPILMEVAPWLSRADGQHKDHEGHKGIGDRGSGIGDDHEELIYGVFVIFVIFVIFVHGRD